MPAGRIIFLGDSITFGGHYVEFIDALLRLENPQSHRELLDLGLPERNGFGTERARPRQAGSFPGRVARAARANSRAGPARLVVACYGMNDGIYYPPSEERLAKYQDGIRFLARAERRRPTPGCCTLTPPVFDPVPIQGKTLPAGLAEYPSPRGL